MPTTLAICQKCGRLYEGTACDRCGDAGGHKAALAPVRTPDAPVPTRAAVAPPRSQPVAHGTYRLTFHGSGGSFLGIHIVNMLLTMVTLGIYYFWGKVKTRNYLYSQSEFNGDRFAYHGTGKELFLGFLRAGLAFGGIALLFKAAPFLPGGMAMKITVMVIAYCALLVFIPFAIAASRRYRMSRSSWRGIRFSFRGSVGDFTRLYLKGVGLSVLTLGFYYPYFVVKQQKFLVSYTHFGDVRFGFDGQGRELRQIYYSWMFLPFLAVVLMGILVPLGARLGEAGKMMAILPFLIVPIIGLGWFWFQAAKQRYLWNHTTFGSARFEATMTGGRYLLLKLGNGLLLVLTMGLAWPWVMVRNINFVYNHLSLQGAIDLAAVQQEAQSATAIGEGVDTVMDLDVGFAG